MQHLDELGLLRAPQRQFPRRSVVGPVTQRHAGQRTQHGLHVIGAHPDAEAHVAELEFQVQCLIARDHAAHQHIAAATGVLGEGMHGDVHAQAPGAVAAQVKRLEGQAGAPGVVQRGRDAAGAAHAHEFWQVGKLHGDRARGLQPDQPWCAR